MASRGTLVLTLALAAGPAAAQQAAPTGYSPAAAERQRAVEEAARRSPTPDAARAHSRALSAEAHVAGTEAQARTRDYVVQQMREMGLETEVRTYQVWMPHARSAQVWRVAPDPRELATAEPPVPGDSTSTGWQYPAANGYSAAGDVQGELVYAGFGLARDYERLDSLGVQVRGRIVIARYGRAFRGIKAREAERRGAIGLILYSDPMDDGGEPGERYPDGPMRPGTAIQRGSVYNGAGDPTTPGWASVRGARRLAFCEEPAPDSALPVRAGRPGRNGERAGPRPTPRRRVQRCANPVPRIPVVALGYDNAAELLRGLAGPEAPQAIRGGLPFPYRLGPGPVTARVAVRTDSASGVLKPIYNTLGILRGSEFPDEMVIIGAHRDSWGPGAADDVSGTVAVLEAARAAAEQARAGNRPRRTLVFATWDAEEWGLIGSTEYVEEDSARLTGAVAYLNQDVNATGPVFGAGGSPSLRALLRDVARTVPDPGGEGSVYEAWRRSAQVPADSLEPAMGDPGGGSDFAGFYNHLGIPHVDWGFGGRYGVYHSQYDSYLWMTRFGDPDFRRHTASAQIAAAAMLRLANADVVPYDYVEYARNLRARLPALDSSFVARGYSALNTAALNGALDRMERAAARFARSRDEVLAAGAPERRRLERANDALRAVERMLVRASGLEGRPWYRNLVFAADNDNSYATLVFPGVQEAVRRGERREAEQEMAELAGRVARASEALFLAADILTGDDRR